MTVEHTPEGLELLDFEPTTIHSYNEKEYVRIGVVPEDAVGEDGTLSLVIVHFAKRGGCSACQACLTKYEAQLLMDGLRRAVKRMKKLDEDPETY